MDVIIRQHAWKAFRHAPGFRTISFSDMCLVPKAQYSALQTVFDQSGQHRLISTTWSEVVGNQVGSIRRVPAADVIQFAAELIAI
jgi:hypothetical protein